MVREKARGSKLEDIYKRKKGRVINETQHTLTMKEAQKSTQTFSKREITKPQPPLVPQNSQSENVDTSKQKIDDKQTETDEQQNPKKRREKRIPAEIKRPSNWRELMESDEEEEEIAKRRIERKQQTNQNNQTRQ